MSKTNQHPNALEQTSADNQADPGDSPTGAFYVNNTQIGGTLDFTNHLSGNNPQFRPYQIFRNRNNAGNWAVLGSAIIFGSLTSDERQSFCDYFQANGGVLA